MSGFASNPNRFYDTRILSCFDSRPRQKAQVKSILQYAFSLLGLAFYPYANNTSSSTYVTLIFH